MSEVFEAEIDPVMVKLGYCCGRKHTFSPQTLCCYGQQNTICTIPRDGKYYVYENRSELYPLLFYNYFLYLILINILIEIVIHNFKMRVRLENLKLRIF